MKSIIFQKKARFACVCAFFVVPLSRNWVYYAIVENILCYLLLAIAFPSEGSRRIEILLVGFGDDDEQLYMARIVLRRP